MLCYSPLRFQRVTQICLFSQDAYSEIAYLFAEFFRDLDIVPSDIIAGLVLLRQRQRAKRNAVLDEASPVRFYGILEKMGLIYESACGKTLAFSVAKQQPTKTFIHPVWD